MRATRFSETGIGNAVRSLGDSNPYRFRQQRHVPRRLPSKRGASPCEVPGGPLREVRAGASLPSHFQGLPTADSSILPAKGRNPHPGDSRLLEGGRCAQMGSTWQVAGNLTELEPCSPPQPEQQTDLNKGVSSSSTSQVTR